MTNPPLSGSDSLQADIKKYMSMTQNFIYNIVECIYEIRYPNGLVDLIPDECNFSLFIKKSPSLRQLLSSTELFGWFKVDVYVSSPEKLIERWIIVQERSDISNNDLKNKLLEPNLRLSFYQKFSASLRSLYSLLNALPAKTLQLILDKMPCNERKIYINCGHFHPLPHIKEEQLPEDVFYKEIEIPCVETVIGKSSVFVKYLIDISDEVPKLEHYILGQSLSKKSSGRRYSIMKYPTNLDNKSDSGGNSHLLSMTTKSDKSTSDNDYNIGNTDRGVDDNGEAIETDVSDVFASNDQNEK